VAAELFHADGWTDRLTDGRRDRQTDRQRDRRITNLKVDFRNFANGPNILSNFDCLLKTNV